MVGCSVTNVVKAKIIRIGNSQGVRLPKIWLDQLNLGPEVEMAMQADKIVIRSVLRPRQGWEVQFAAMAEAGDDRLLDAPVSTAFDQDEWEW
jgi:antitoxin MazE